VKPHQVKEELILAMEKGFTELEDQSDISKTNHESTTFRNV